MYRLLFTFLSFNSVALRVFAALILSQLTFLGNSSAAQLSKAVCRSSDGCEYTCYFEGGKSCMATKGRCEAPKNAGLVGACGPRGGRIGVVLNLDGTDLLCPVTVRTPMFNQWLAEQEPLTSCSEYPVKNGWWGSF